VYAAYGTLMLLYVMIGSTILSMGPWLMSYDVMYNILYDINHGPIDKIVLPIVT